MISLSPSVLEAANAYLVHCGVSRLHSDTRIQAFYKAKLETVLIFLLTMDECANTTVKLFRIEGWFTRVWNDLVLHYPPLIHATCYQEIGDNYGIQSGSF